MGLLTFKGGIHPYDGKELSKDSPVERYLPKGNLVFPLSQHIGAPAVPVVEKGSMCLPDRKLRMPEDLYLRRFTLLYREQ